MSTMNEKTIRQGLVRFNGLMWPEKISRDPRVRYMNGVRVLKHTVALCARQSLAVQAGGHCGVWPRYLAGDFHKVVTFEPHPDLFPALKLNVQANVETHNLALGNSTDPIEFVRQGGTMGGSHVDAKAAKRGRNFVMVDQVKLDSFGLSPDLIVLDIEGSELAALLGAEETIRRCRPVLHLEVCGHIERYERGTTKELEDFLKGFGYEAVKRLHKDTVFVSR